MNSKLPGFQISSEQLIYGGRDCPGEAQSCSDASRKMYLHFPASLVKGKSVVGLIEF